MSEPTPEAVEAGAEAMWNQRPMIRDDDGAPRPFGSLRVGGPYHDRYMGQARAALSAAAPYLIREAQADALEDAAEEWAVRSQTFLNTMEHMVGSREYSHDDILRYGAYSAEAQTSGYRLKARAAAIRDGAQ